MYVITPMFRVSYPYVFKPRKNELSGKDEFSLVALFKKGEDLSKLHVEILRAAREKWGENVQITKTEHGTYQLTNPGKPSFAIRLPLRDQGEREGEKGLPMGYEKGAMFLNLKSTSRPGLVNAQNEDIIDESDFYAGCYARAAINAYAYDQKGNRGVAFGLQNVQKMKDGEVLSGRVKAQDCFEPVASDSAEEIFA